MTDALEEVTSYDLRHTRTEIGKVKIRVRIRMAITMNTAIMRTHTALFKMLEIVLVLICLRIARLGLTSGSTIWPLGHHDLLFFVTGTLVGFAIIVPTILFAYMLGAAMTILVRENCKRGNACIYMYVESIETVAEHVTRHTHTHTLPIIHLLLCRY